MHKIIDNFLHIDIFHDSRKNSITITKKNHLYETLEMTIFEILAIYFNF